MLSDACAEFITSLVKGETDHKTATQRLASAIERYSGQFWSYEPGEIARLRQACAAVLAAPAGAAARSAWLAPLVNLVTLAEQVRAYHDRPSSGACAAAPEA